jgi:hypothetical protein
VLAALTASLVALGGVLVGHLLTRRTARELDVRWQREETMRLLRWAADNAVSEQAVQRHLGVATLRASGRSPLLQRDDLSLVGAVLGATFRAHGGATTLDREEAP